MLLLHYNSFGLWSEYLAIWVAQWLVFRLLCCLAIFASSILSLSCWEIILNADFDCIWLSLDVMMMCVHPISSTLSIWGHRYSIMMYVHPCTTRNNGIATVIRHTLIFY